MDQDVRAQLRGWVIAHLGEVKPATNAAPLPDEVLALRDAAVEFHEFELHPETHRSSDRLAAVLRWQGEAGPVTDLHRWFASELRVDHLEAQLEEARALLGEAREGPAAETWLRELRRRLDPGLPPVVTEVDIIVDIAGEAWASIATGTTCRSWRCTGHRPWEVRDGVWWPSPQPNGSRFPDDDLPSLHWFWHRDGDVWTLRDPDGCG